MNVLVLGMNSNELKRIKKRREALSIWAAGFCTAAH